MRNPQPVDIPQLPRGSRVSSHCSGPPLSRPGQAGLFRDTTPRSRSVFSLSSDDPTASGSWGSCCMDHCIRIRPAPKRESSGMHAYMGGHRMLPTADNAGERRWLQAWEDRRGGAWTALEQAGWKSELVLDDDGVRS